MYPGEQQDNEQEERRTGGRSYTDRKAERETGRWPSNRKHLSLLENPSPDNPNLYFFWRVPPETQAQRKRGKGILHEEEREKAPFIFMVGVGK